MKKSVFTSIATLVLVFSVGACSKKKVQDEGDVAGDTTAMAPTDVDGMAAGSGQKIAELNTIYFAFDSFALTGESKSILKKSAEWLKANSEKNVQIEGHTDERGTTEYNLALGDRRAGAVKDYLISQGVPAAQVSTISYGEERPSSQGSDESAWSQNRRAEFVSGS